MVELGSNKLTQITKDGSGIKSIMVPDWVYEEEFSMVQAFKWFLTVKKIAFSPDLMNQKCPEFNMQLWGPSISKGQ
jgi:hypothetical protein